MDDLPKSNFWDRWLLLVCPATPLWGALLSVWDAWRARRRRKDADAGRQP